MANENKLIESMSFDFSAYFFDGSIELDDNIPPDEFMGLIRKFFGETPDRADLESAIENNEALSRFQALLALDVELTVPESKVKYLLEICIANYYGRDP